MTVFRPQPHACDRAREWASLRVDAELSELEQALLAAHLGRCSACAAYVAGVEGATAQIRAAAPVALTRQVALPLRRRLGYSTRVLQASTAAAAVLAAAVGLGTLFGSLGSSSSALANSGRMPASMISSGPGSESDALLRAPRLAMIKAQLGVGKQRGLGLEL